MIFRRRDNHELYRWFLNATANIFIRNRQSEIRHGREDNVKIKQERYNHKPSHRKM